MTTIEAPASTDTEAPAEENTAPAAAEPVEPVPVPLPAEVADDLRRQFAERIAQGLPARVLFGMNPNHVVFGSSAGFNVRDDAVETITDEFVASIKQRILQTPTAYLRADNIIQVSDGQRRTYAARAAGLPSIDYLVGPEPEGTDAARRASEIVDQVEANERRVDLSDEQLYRAQEELALLALPTGDKTKALKQLGISTKEAKAIKALSKAGNAREAAVTGELDLIQAAAAMEFEDDDNAMAQLEAAARRGNFDPTIVRLREERRVRTKREEAIAPYAARGFRILARTPWNDERKQFVPIEDLRTREGDKVTEADIAASQWAVHVDIGNRIVVTATGEEIHDRQVDRATYDDPDREPAKGKHHARDVSVEEVVTVAYYCHDHKRAGLRKVKEGGETAGAATQTVTIINKVAKSDTLERRAFVAKWLAKIPKAVPAEVQLWRLRLEGAAPEIFKEYTARSTASELLAMPGDELADGTAFDGISLARAQMIGIGLAMGAIEGRMHPREDKPNYWRIAAPPENVFWTVDMTLSQPYLRLLISLGHVPGIAERLTLGDITVDQALAEIAAAEAAEAERGSQLAADADQD
ncbi:ParB N-terminal domain-containing protein [Nocardia tengchongensis]|uniref:ParB N-terminal domain-containing protein n=1 Tax=Nocardia tengchongensis TaxID=2055889 RepID=UPI00361D0902